MKDAVNKRKKVRRVVVDLNEESFALINKVAEEENRTMSEVMRRALSLYAMMPKVNQFGARSYTVTGEHGKSTEKVIFV